MYNEAAVMGIPCIGLNGGPEVQAQRSILVRPAGDVGGLTRRMATGPGWVMVAA